MNAKRIPAVALTLLTLTVLGIYAGFVVEVRQRSPLDLLSCMEAEAPPLAWTCRQILRHDSLRSDQVAQLNREAGALYPVLVKDLATAEEMLSLFIERGVDVNAGNASMKNWTALYSTIGSSDLARTQLLLRYGANADVRDADEMTPLDSARRLLQMYPGEPDRQEIVRLLEASLHR